MAIIQDFKSGFHIGMHGLGMLNGIPHTNSIEALFFWRNRDINFFEVDIAVTDDNQYILLSHNASEKDLEKLEVFERPIDGLYTLEWIQGIRTCKKSIKEGLKILTLQEFLDVVTADHHVIAMIDPYGRDFEDVLNIANIVVDYESKYPDLIDRVLLELYTLEDVIKIQKLYKNLHIIACVREDSYDFWGAKKDFNRLQNIDFISCKWKCVESERELISYCNKNNIGVLSLSRFDNCLESKKKIGININLVDVCARGNVLLYLKNIIQFVFHMLVILFYGKAVNK